VRGKLPEMGKFLMIAKKIVFRFRAASLSMDLIGKLPKPFPVAQ
jgi:hypothetical protein